MATDLNGVYPREAIPLDGEHCPALKDKQLVLTLQSFQTEGLFKEYLECEALKAIRRKRDVFGTESEYQDAIRAVSRDFAARAYAWGKPECRRCLEDEEHVKHLFWLITQQRTVGGENSPNAWLLRSQWEDVWREAGGSILEAWARINDPNRTTPGGQTDRPAAA